jgi:ketosteroid isomerase-like protein
VGPVSVRDAILSGDGERFKAALAPEVVWVGVLPGMLCRNREQVLATLDRAGLRARTFSPEILAEEDGRIVVDPHAQPPTNPYPNLHQVLVVTDEKIVEMRDYPNRESAMAALETPW